MDALEQAAREIDEVHDAMLYDGMPGWEVLQVERQRETAHAKLAAAVMRRALATQEPQAKPTTSTAPIRRLW